MTNMFFKRFENTSQDAAYIDLDMHHMLNFFIDFLYFLAF